eukprot:gene10588-3106_t
MLLSKKEIKKLIKLKYFYDSNLPNICDADIGINKENKIVSQDIFDSLVNDKINLRKISTIRYYNEDEDAYMLLKDNELDATKIKNDTLTLKLEKSSSTSRYAGPFTNFLFNFGLLINNMQPTLRVKMNTVAGTIERVFDGYFKGIGLTVDCSVRCQGFFFIRSPFHDVYWEQPIELGKGIDIAFPFALHITYMSFKNTSGGVLMIGIPVGFAAGITYFEGGSLIPKK